MSRFDTRGDIAAALRDMLAQRPEPPEDEWTLQALNDYHEETEWFASDLAWLAESIVRAVDGESVEVQS